jgi:enoyl-CoA hydratase
MDYKSILYGKADRIAKITVNRPEVRNAISIQVYKELDDAFTKAEEDDEVRVIVVAGAGDNFGAGHDIGSSDRLAEQNLPVGAAKLAESMKDLSKFMWGMRDRQRNLSKPTIAMVQGYCIMGSWMLASACDLIIASEDARFVDRAVSWGGTHVEYFTLFWDVGPRKAKEYLWTGDFLDAKEAWRLGMVNRVVPREQLEEETITLAKRIALNDPFALRLSKSSVNQAMDIMGQSAAMKASFYMFALGYAHFHEAMPAGATMEWAKSRLKDSGD